MAVLTRQHTGTARSTERIGYKTVGELDTIVGDTVQIRCFDIPRIVTAHHLRRVVICHDIHDVVLFGRCFLFGTARSGCSGQCSCPQAQNLSSIGLTK